MFIAIKWTKKGNLDKNYKRNKSKCFTCKENYKKKQIEFFLYVSSYWTEVGAATISISSSEPLSLP